MTDLKKIRARVKRDTAKLQAIAHKKEQRERDRRGKKKADLQAKEIKLEQTLNKVRVRFFASLTTEQKSWYDEDQAQAKSRGEQELKTKLDAAYRSGADSGFESGSKVNERYDSHDYNQVTGHEYGPND